MRIARKGVRNLLIHAGILRGEMEVEASQRLDMPSMDCFTFAQGEGMIGFAVDLGESVEKGDVLARVWSVDLLGVAPEEFRARLSGILAARHFPGLVKSGDCVAVIGVPG